MKTSVKNYLELLPFLFALLIAITAVICLASADIQGDPDGQPYEMATDFAGNRTH